MGERERIGTDRIVWIQVGGLERRVEYGWVECNGSMFKSMGLLIRGPYVG
jgi:hypothetical protein